MYSYTHQKEATIKNKTLQKNIKSTSVQLGLGLEWIYNPFRFYESP